MAALLELVKLFSRKRRADEVFLTCQYKMNEEMAKKRCQREMEFEMEASEPAVLPAIVITKSDRNERGPDELRNGNWWVKDYQNWDQDCHVVFRNMVSIFSVVRLLPVFIHTDALRV